jgi:predicted signal transduction protein with EAL and GGDEF domain
MKERADKFFHKTKKMNPDDEKTKMRFFYEELKNNMFFGLLSKTSKIAPRHVRLTLMYYTISLQILIITLFMIFGLEYYVTLISMF